MGGTARAADARMRPTLSPLSAWALSVGSAIGWGSLVVTSTDYLPQAGPAGSVLGILIGFAMMLMVANHYHFLANRFPGTGGLYNYIKYVFGYDRAFLVGWFMFLIYISIFWANATSIPLFARYFLSGVFRVGYLYSVFGYEVYLGEALLTLAAIALVALLCARSKRATARAMVALVLVFTAGITICFVASMAGFLGAGKTMEPAFVVDAPVWEQVARVAFTSPWAFIGFESVSHTSAEYRFNHKRLFKIFVAALVVITALYVFVTLMSVTCYPDTCSSWFDYISRLGEFEGIEGLPAFHAANHYLGSTGVHILMASLLALVASSLIGMLRTVSRLCYSVAQDAVLPRRFARLSSRQIPVNAIMLAALVSLPIPFFGRTAIGWIVDTTTIGATILYGVASIAVFKVSGQEGARKDRAVSGVCLVILVIYMALLIFPGLFLNNAIATETYVLMIAWSIIGLVFFNRVISKDHARNFGKAIIVWAALLAFIVLMALTLAKRTNEAREIEVIDEIAAYVDGGADPDAQALATRDFLELKLQELHDADNLSVLIISGLFGLSFTVMLVNYASMRKWERRANKERDQARAVAFTDSLTGVKSKHAFAQREGAMESHIVEGDAAPFAVVVADVNGLKQVNDTLGHKAGDDYIRSASAMLCEHFSHSPVFRVGGDEFVVLLEGRDLEAREEILAALNAEVEGNIGSGKVVVSLGTSVFDPAADASFHEVFERADNLMYERKAELKAMGAPSRD